MAEFKFPLSFATKRKSLTDLLVCKSFGGNTSSAAGQGVIGQRTFGAVFVIKLKKSPQKMLL